ncbi:BQ2448_5236 [Microbotryum intermedium]|uniref:BQ2448_5236 protein n=1 Tax=Microbotryum intermedium TaxID=269621 RepID=A0A238F3M9_9BASI|nr:BQ2448_5236 [Microbotryum intermedium]
MQLRSRLIRIYQQSADLDPKTEIIGKVALGRLWGNSARTATSNTQIDAHILPAGFEQW